MFLVAALLCFATAAGAAAIAWHIAESLPADDREWIRRAVQAVVGWVQNRRVEADHRLESSHSGLPTDGESVQDQ